MSNSESCISEKDSKQTTKEMNNEETGEIIREEESKLINVSEEKTKNEDKVNKNRKNTKCNEEHAMNISLTSLTGICDGKGVIQITESTDLSSKPSVKEKTEPNATTCVERDKAPGLPSSEKKTKKGEVEITGKENGQLAIDEKNKDTEKTKEANLGTKKENKDKKSRKQDEEIENKDGKKLGNWVAGLAPGAVRNLGNTSLKGQPPSLFLSMPAGGGGGGLSLLSAGLPPGRYVILPSTTSSIPSISNISSNVSSLLLGGKSSLLAQISNKSISVVQNSSSVTTTTTSVTSSTPSVLHPTTLTESTPTSTGRNSTATGRSFRGRRKSYTTAEKLAMIEAVESGQKKSNVADQFGVAPSTLACILLQKNKIRCDQIKIDMSRRRIRRTRTMPITPSPLKNLLPGRRGVQERGNDNPFVHFLSPLSPPRPPVFEESPEEIFSTDLAYKRWRDLRDRYVKERKKETQSLQSPDGVIYKSRWHLMRHLDFLQDSIKHRDNFNALFFGRDNVTGVQEQQHQEREININEQVVRRSRRSLEGKRVEVNHVSEESSFRVPSYSRGSSGSDDRGQKHHKSKGIIKEMHHSVLSAQDEPFPSTWFFIPSTTSTYRVPDLADRMGMDGGRSSSPSKMEGSSNYLTCSPLISAMSGMHEDMMSGAGPSSSSQDTGESEAMQGDYDQDDIDVKSEPVFNVEPVHAGGRTKAPEWAEVNVLEDEKGKVECKHCFALISNRIARIQTHLQKCKKICEDESQTNTQSSCDRRSSQSSPAPAGMAGPYLLKKETHCTTILDQLLRDDTFCDVTLTAEGQSMRAHKIVLCLASAYFRQVLNKEPTVQNVIVFRDIKFMELKNLINFIYTGEATVDAADLESFMKTAEMLEVTSLCDGQRKIPKNLIPKQKEPDNEKGKTTFASKRSAHNSCVSPPPSKARKIDDTPKCAPKSATHPSTSGGGIQYQPQLILHTTTPIKTEPPSEEEQTEDYSTFEESEMPSPTCQLSVTPPSVDPGSSSDKLPVGKCPFCPSSQHLLKGLELTNHMSTYHPEKTVFTCETCSLVFLKKGAFEAHQDDCNR